MANSATKLVFLHNLSTRLHRPARKRNNSKDMKKHKKLTQLVGLIIVFLMVSAVSVRRDQKWMGHSLKKEATTEAKPASVLRTEADGTQVINTTTLGKDITGFGGTVPLEIYIKDGRITQVKALPNQESPEFFGRASKLLDRWKGKSLEEAGAMKVDGVSGATYSSKAIIGNMQRGIAYAQKTVTENHWYSQLDLSLKTLAGLIVVLMASVLPLFIHNKVYRIVQQVLNVAVLGFWCGSFLNYTTLISITSNGLKPLAVPIATVMLIVAFIYPFFGKPAHYCTHVCPFGSLQELAGRCVPYRLKLSAKVVKRLTTFRRLLWAALMICLWTGVWFQWIDLEPFSAFIFESASVGAIVIAVLFLLLSTVIMRPYCRFVCPTGTLLRLGK